MGLNWSVYSPSFYPEGGLLYLKADLVQGGLISVQTDSLSQPVYVECSSYNVSFYERFGFQVKGKVVLNGAEKPITLESMVREPT